MLEQVWKNVAGNLLPYRMEKGELIITIPRESNVRVHDLSQFIQRVKRALPHKVATMVDIKEDGTVDYILYEGDVLKEEVAEVGSSATEE